jgi:hypothetical protein
MGYRAVLTAVLGAKEYNMTLQACQKECHNMYMCEAISHDPTGENCFEWNNVHNSLFDNFVNIAVDVCRFHLTLAKYSQYHEVAPNYMIYEKAYPINIVWSFIIPVIMILMHLKLF